MGSGGSGTAGGGFINITASTVLTVDASIQADGAAGSGSAGAGIWIQTSTLTGNGIIFLWWLVVQLGRWLWWPHQHQRQPADVVYWLVLRIWRVFLWLKFFHAWCCRDRVYE